MHEADVDRGLAGGSPRGIDHPLFEQVQGFAAAVRQVAAEGGAAYTGTSQYAVNRRLRVDRVLLAVGASAAVAGVVILWRSRRR